MRADLKFVPFLCGMKTFLHRFPQGIVTRAEKNVNAKARLDLDNKIHFVPGQDLQLQDRALPGMKWEV